MSESRVEAMVRYLRDHRREIEAARAGRVEFDYGPLPPVKGRLTQFDELAVEPARG